MYEKIIIYVSRIQEIQNKINDLEGVRNHLQVWIESDYYPEFIVAKFCVLLHQIDEILKLLNLMLAMEKYNYVFDNEYFIEVSLIPFVLIYPYPVSFIVDLFDTVLYYSDYEEQDYEDDEDCIFYDLLNIFSEYISSIDETSTDSGGSDIDADIFRNAIKWHEQRRINNKSTKKNKFKP